MPHRIGALSRVYAFGATWMGVVVMPVYVPFLTSRGLSLGDVVTLQSLYAFFMLCLEIPTGYVCDRFGRRATILTGATLNLLGFIGFAMARGFAPYVAVQFVLAMGYSLVSGADIALTYDILDTDAASRERRRKVVSHLVAAKVLGEAGFGLLGAWLATRSLAWVGEATAAEAVLPLLIALTLPRGSNSQAAIKLSDLPPATRALFAQPGLLLVFANMIAWGLATFIAVWLLQPYWQEQGVALRWFGVLWAMTLGLVALSSYAAHHLGKIIGPGGTLLVLALAPILGYAGMAGLSGSAGLAAGFLFYVSRGLNAVSLTEAFNHRVPSRLRATFNSLNSGVFRLLFAVIGPLLGIGLRRFGLDATLAVLAGSFLCVFVLITVPVLRRPSAL